MNNPMALDPARPVTRLGSILGVPLVAQGPSVLPANQVLFAGIFAWKSAKTRPDWPAWRHLALGTLEMAVVLGSEWLHNLAHAAAARAVGQPVDTLRLAMGMPILIYDQPEAPSITPRQHILRSAAGPVFNLLLLLASLLARRATRPHTAAREVSDAAVAMNTFIAFGSLLPVPVFDGGPILKWSLIGAGRTPAQAEQVARRANQVLAPGLLAAAARATTRRRWLLAVALAILGTLSLAFSPRPARTRLL